VHQPTFTLPDEPITQQTPPVSWPAVALPIVMSLAVFLITKSPYSLVFAALSPIALLTNSAVNRRRARRHFQRAHAAYLSELAALQAKVSAFHERERMQWLRQHPDAFVLGWSDHPSAAKCAGGGRSEQQRILKERIERNPEFPIALEPDAQRSPELTIAFEGVLARTLKSRARSARISVSNELHRFPAQIGSAHRYLERGEGGARLHTGEPVRLIVQPQRSQRQVVTASDVGELRATLRVLLGRDAAGDPIEVDVIHDGPHALIAGTTGSGKSELLRTLICQLVVRYAPEEVQLLLIDFKGGATFQPFVALPHTLQLVTDLESDRVSRAVSGLRAELRRRERILRHHSLSDIDQLPSSERIPRLIIAVDEFATFVTELPEAHAAFTDVAARGRALGVHLVLATQRPGGVVRDALAANCTLRFCLRVANAQESHSVIGSDSAASLHSHGIGACIHVANGAHSLPWHVERADLDALRIAHKPSDGKPAQMATWLPPLPECLTIEAWPKLPERRCYLGLRDQPSTQSQEKAVWNVEQEPVLLVLGGGRSGKSTLLASIAAQWRPPEHAFAVRRVPATADAVWDALIELQQSSRSASGNTAQLWLFDDLDYAWEQFSGEHAARASDMLSTVIRHTPAQHAIVVSMQRIPAALSALMQPIEHRLYLRAASREQHLAWGLDLQGYSPRTPPGRGEFGGEAIQVPWCEQDYEAWLSPFATSWAPLPPMALVSERAALLCRQFPETIGSVNWVPLSENADLQAGALRSGLTRDDASPCRSGTLEEWAALLRQSATLRTTCTWLFDEYSLSEIRQVLGRAWTAPPVTSPHTLLSWSSDIGFQRVLLTLQGSDTVSS